jgi:hypothetical protein
MQRADNGTVCVRVRIDVPGLEVTLGSAGCGFGGGGGASRHSPKKEALLSMWSDHNLSDSSFPSGQLIAFLTKVEKQFC